MISALSNLADRNFVLGYLLPVIIAALIAIGLFRDLPFVQEYWQALSSVDGFERLTLALLCLWTVAVLLLAFNHQLYRAMEGYWGPLKWIRFFKNNELAAYDADQKNQADLKKVSDDTYAAEKLAEKSGTATDEYRQAKKTSDAAWEAYWNAVRDSRLAFPRERKHVLPTRFGNILRAFETYSYDVYGIDSIPGWLRLSGVIPEDFQELIGNARAEVDFFLNNCLLLSAIGMVTLFATVWSVMGLWLPLAAPDFHISWLLAGEVAPVLAVACYHMAVSRAPAWGNLVRSAFDLYLPNLAKQMGYALPATLGEQTRFWKKIDDMFLYSKPVPDVFRRPPPADDDKSG